MISNATAHGWSVHQLVVLLSATEILGLTYQRANCFSVAFFSRLVFFNKSPIGVQAPPVFMHILFVVPMFGRFWACSAGLKSAGWLKASKPAGWLVPSLTKSLFTSCQNSIFLLQHSVGTIFFSPAEQGIYRQRPLSASTVQSQ